MTKTQRNNKFINRPTSISQALAQANNKDVSPVLVREPRAMVIRANGRREILAA